MTNEQTTDQTTRPKLRKWKTPELNRLYVYNRGELDRTMLVLLVAGAILGTGVTLISGKLDGWVGLGALLAFGVAMGVLVALTFRWAAGRNQDHELPAEDAENVREAMGWNAALDPRVILLRPTAERPVVECIQSTESGHHRGRPCVFCGDNTVPVDA